MSVATRTAASRARRRAVLTPALGAVVVLLPILAGCTESATDSTASVEQPLVEDVRPEPTADSLEDEPTATDDPAETDEAAETAEGEEGADTADAGDTPPAADPAPQPPAEAAPPAEPAPVPAPAPAPAPAPEPPPAPAPSAIVSAESQVEARLVELANAARAAEGLGALTRDSRIDTVARTWSQHLAAGGLSLAHNPSFADEYPAGWRAAGENVAWIKDGGTLSPGEVAQRMHDGWMASSGHRANILGQYTTLGIGVAHHPDHGWYLTQNFATY
ncbi:CAP domain-containing protein [Actinotalea sp. K2]|uniref:CAP domain-containing protein n=1 Tax=Actinotalea sp. K2 TaxID=2939438 RepID=UPI002017772F|nr:CAP domain-containing protein [Actinotalea sp. K2]MCL3861589.1 CAP domain-containing protein [Actinotalea sp. K2]